MRGLVLVCVLLGFSASAALAGGVSLAWNDCGGGGGVSYRGFACNTNVGTNDLYVSFEPAVEIPDLNGSNPTIELRSGSNPVPPWWQFKNFGSCRLSSLSAITGIPGSCQDAWAGQGVSGVAAYVVTSIVPSLLINRAKILGSVSVPTGSA